MWGELSWGELSLGRVVCNSAETVQVVSNQVSHKHKHKNLTQIMHLPDSAPGQILIEGEFHKRTLGALGGILRIIPPQWEITLVERTLKKIYGRHHDLVDPYSVAPSKLVTDLMPVANN